MDTFARAVEVACRIRENTHYEASRLQRYRSFDGADGAPFEQGVLDLAALRDPTQSKGEPEHRSGRQEWYENLVNQYL